MLKEQVTEDNTALALGSGSLRVYGTPAMLLLVEKTAVALLEGNLPAGMTSVGTRLAVDHMAPTPVGMEVTAQVWLCEVEKRKLVFEVTDPVTFPPSFSISSFSSFLFEKCARLPVITKIRPDSGCSSCVCSLTRSRC